MYRRLLAAALLLVAALSLHALVREVPGAGAALAAGWPFLLPWVSAAVMYRLWRVRGRDPDPLSVAAWYEPPDGLRPGPMGALLDHAADLREVAATVADLAVRDFFDVETEPGGDRAFVLNEQRKVEWAELPGYEQELLRCLFRGGLDARVRLSDRREHFHRYYRDMMDGMWRELVARGYYAAHPLQARGPYIAAAFVLGGAAALAATLAGRVEPAAQAAAWLTGAPVLGFGWFMPLRTRRGTEVLRQVLGFREFLDRVESDRFRRMIRSPADFERWLPYAVALGLEDRWADALDDIYSAAHDLDRRMGWYWLGADPSQRSSLRRALV